MCFPLSPTQHEGNRDQSWRNRHFARIQKMKQKYFKSRQKNQALSLQHQHQETSAQWQNEDHKIWVQSMAT